MRKTQRNIVSRLCICEEEYDARRRPSLHSPCRSRAIRDRLARFYESKRESAVNDNEPRPVTIITGRAWREKDGKSEGVHVMLVAPDDDTAVRTALEALTKEGFAEAELDQIGDMEGMPDEEPHASAYQGALEGDVSIVTFEEAD
jgi:hypothetical protein